MTTTELRAKLMKYSPFVLQKTVEESDHFIFLADTILLNDNCIGKYRISEEEDRFSIQTDNPERVKNNEIELQIDYREKKIVLHASDVYTASRLADCQGAQQPALVPMKRIVDDEQSEL